MDAVANVTLTQALLIALFAGIAGIDLFNVLTHIHRPIITGPIVGLILGEPQLGLVAGATFELMWMGLVPLAGAQPPNVVLGGIIGTAFAIVTGQTAEQAILVAVPFAIFVQICITFLFTVFSPLMSVADGYAKNLNFRGIANLNYLGMTILFSSAKLDGSWLRWNSANGRRQKGSCSAAALVSSSCAKASSKLNNAW